MTKILIADDVGDNRYLLATLFGGSGYEVVSASDGVEALRLAQSSPPDLVVTDILMPGMDGFELCRRWKQDERLKPIPLVIYTATYTDPKDERLALSLGADRFLVKPQKPESLLQVVREVLEATPGNLRSGTVGDETALLHQHNEALMRKLEKKVHDLESEVAQRRAVEATLRESESRFRLLADNALDVVWSMDFDGRFTYVSPSVEKIRGYTPEEVIRQSMQQRQPPEWVVRFREKAGSVSAAVGAGADLGGGDVFEIEETRKDGSTVWSEISVGIMRDPTGKAIGLQGVSRDIARRKRAEEQACQALDSLAKRTRELEGLLEGATAILAGDDFETTARYVCNRARALIGARAGYVALLSDSGEENEVLFIESGGLPCAVDPSLPMPIRGLRAEAYRSGEVVCDNDFMHSRWASLIPEEHVELRNVLFVPLNIRGETVGLMGLANKPGDFDASDRKVAAALGQLAALGLQRSRADQELRERADLLRIAGGMARLGGWSFDLKEQRVRWSDEVAAIHEMPAGTSPTLEEAIGFYAPEWQARMREVLDTCVRDGTPCDEEMELVTAAGQRIWVRTIGEAIRNGAGNIAGVQGAFQDITDRRRAEDEQQKLQSQLLQAQKIESIGRLAGGVAHDFNNLLSVVLSYVSFAMDAVREGDPLRDDLDEIRSAGERAAALTRQLLAFSRKQILQPEVINLNKVVSGIESMLRRLLGEDIEIQTDFAEDLGNVMADPGQIEQVLMNLAVNARDAMPQGGTLTLETANVEVDEGSAEQLSGVRPGRCVMLSVADTGIGMDPATRQHLFEPFFTTKEKGKGTGLGLSTVYGIVRQSGGSIWVYSEPGRGTIFKVYLPWVDTPEAEMRSKSVPATATGSETVLVVEDEDAVRKIAQRILRNAGYTVLAATGGGDALLLGEKHGEAIDLLLTDVVMPQMSGREIADRLTRTCPKLRILYMSGYTDRAIAQHSVLEPGTRFIAKPFAAAELTRKVREALDQGE